VQLYVLALPFTLLLQNFRAPLNVRETLEAALPTMDAYNASVLVTGAVMIALPSSVTMTTHAKMGGCVQSIQLTYLNTFALAPSGSLDQDASTERMDVPAIVALVVSMAHAMNVRQMEDLCVCVMPATGESSVNI